MNSTCSTAVDQHTGPSGCSVCAARTRCEVQRRMPACAARAARASGITRAHQEQRDVNELDDEQDQPDFLQVREDGNPTDDEHHQAEQDHVEAGIADGAVVAYVNDAHDEQRQAHHHIHSKAYEQQQLDDRVQGTHGWLGCARVTFGRPVVGVLLGVGARALTVGSPAGWFTADSWHEIKPEFARVADILSPWRVFCCSWFLANVEFGACPTRTSTRVPVASRYSHK